jgi:hypothetical protein
LIVIKWTESNIKLYTVVLCIVIKCAVEVPVVFKVAIKQATLQKLRDDRNKLLIDTDKYLVIPDMPNITPERIEELKVYRQQLRDYMNYLPDINGIDDVIPPLPEKPSYIK